jgi:AcrR family transcriptional regulator
MNPEETKQKELILRESIISILQGGVKNFTIDSFAQGLGMAKKTIYKFFPSKENLIEYTLMHYLNNLVVNRTHKLMESDENAAIQFYKVNEIAIQTLKLLSTARVSEIKGKYPSIWKKIEKFRQDRRNELLIILDRAKTQDLLMPGVDPVTAADVFVGIIQATLQPEVLLRNNLEPGETAKSIVEIFTRGIFIPESLKEIHNLYEK